VATTTIGQYLIDRLLALGARHVFGVPGDFVLAYYKQLTDSELTVVNTSDEQGAGFAADAYARLNGIGAVCITYGVGSLKVTNTTAQAFSEKSPVVVICGGPGVRERNREALVHHKVRSFESQLRIFEEITIASAILDDPESAQREIDRVLAACMHEKLPVYLELPRDLINAEIEIGPIRAGREKSDPEILAEALAEISRMVGQAKQPVILAGEEIHRFEVADLLPGLLERTGIPCATTTLSKSVIMESHPLYLGVYAGGLGSEVVRDYVESSDCILALGANLSDATLGIHTAKVDRSRLIHVTSDKLTIRRATYDHIVFKDFMLHLEPALGTRPAPVVPNPPRPAPWVAVPDAPITIARLVQCINERLTPQTTVIAEAGDCCFATLDLFVEHAGYMACAYYLSLGFAVPAALGVQLARPAMRPLVLVGDGAFQMTGMELSSFLRAGGDLDPIVIVVNNRGYGTERPMIDGVFNDVNDWRYAEIPRVIGGGRGWDVQTEGELERALTEAEANRGRISILDVRIPIGDISPALHRLTTALGKKARGEG